VQCPYQNKPILKTLHLMQRSSIYLLRKPSSNPLDPKFCCHDNEHRSGKNSRGIIRWPIPENPPIDAKILQISLKLLYKTSYNQFRPKFRCHGNEGRSGKIRLAAFDGPSPKTPLQTQKSCRYLLHRPSYSEFCPKIRYHGNRGRQQRNLNDNIR